MATKNPRILVTVTPDIKASLERLADLSGTSQSKIVFDVLQMYLPVMETVVEKGLELKERYGKEVKELEKGMLEIFEEQTGMKLTKSQLAKLLK